MYYFLGDPPFQTGKGLTLGTNFGSLWAQFFEVHFGHKMGPLWAHMAHFGHKSAHFGHKWAHFGHK